MPQRVERLLYIQEHYCSLFALIEIYADLVDNTDQLRNGRVPLPKGVLIVWNFSYQRFFEGAKNNIVEYFK